MIDPQQQTINSTISPMPEQFPKLAQFTIYSRVQESSI
uniref:Uncharacterized protein n=1 Tax=Arundo donax TaxID=35708 RepID=A0A0A9HFV7_ARUDO